MKSDSWKKVASKLPVSFGNSLERSPLVNRIKYAVVKAQCVKIRTRVTNDAQGSQIKLVDMDEVKNLELAPNNLDQLGHFAPIKVSSPRMELLQTRKLGEDEKIVDVLGAELEHHLANFGAHLTDEIHLFLVMEKVLFRRPKLLQFQSGICLVHFAAFVRENLQGIAQKVSSNKASELLQRINTRIRTKLSLFYPELGKL